LPTRQVGGIKPFSLEKEGEEEDRLGLQSPSPWKRKEKKKNIKIG
jgi:hypothetical protein